MMVGDNEYYEETEEQRRENHVMGATSDPGSDHTVFSNYKYILFDV